MALNPKLARKDAKKIFRSDGDQRRYRKEFCRGRLVINNPFSGFAFVRHHIHEYGLIAVKFTLDAMAQNMFV
jgi:hypothetical protein